MLPETQLAIMAAFVGFLLKTFLAFCICWAISKVVVSPQGKFLVWFALLSFAGAYWLFLIFSFIPHVTPQFVLLGHAAIAAERPLATWLLPSSWSYLLTIVERGLGCLYLIAMAYFLAVRIQKQLRLRWVLRFAYRAPDRIERIFRSIAIHSGTDKIRLLVLSGIYSPATFGWIHPVVLLPPLCLEQDEGELADIFRHELQHVARHDFFFHNVAGLCRALLFFHPALWYAKRRMELESELACDLAVLRNCPERRATYAECLVRFARLHAAQDPTPWNLDFSASSVHLKVRVRSALKETARFPAWLWGLRTSIGMLLFAAFLCISPWLFVVCSYAHRVALPATPSLSSHDKHLRPQKKSVIVRRREDFAPRLDSAETAVSAIANPSKAASEQASVVSHQPDTLLSGNPVPILQQRGTTTARRTTGRPARATVFLISNPPEADKGSRSAAKRRSIASAVMTGASEAVRFAASDEKEIH